MPTTDTVRGKEGRARSPTSLVWREADRWLCEAEREGQKHDIAILQPLRHTGLRIRELAALTLRDITLLGYKRNVTVRSGKG